MGTELLRLKSSLEETYNQMALDPEYEDRLSALQAKDDARLSIVHLLSEYPDFIRKVQPNQISTNIVDISEQERSNKASTFKRVHS